MSHAAGRQSSESSESSESAAEGGLEARPTPAGDGPAEPQEAWRRGLGGRDEIVRRRAVLR